VIKSRHVSWAACALLALVLAFAGCGGDDEDDGAASGGGGGTEKVELTFSTHVPESSELGEIWQWYMDQVTERSDGAVTWKPYWDATLVNADELLPALVDGRVDVGQLAPAFYPTELSLSTAAEIPFVTSNVPAAAAAWTDLGLEEGGPLRTQWESAQAVPMGFYVAPPPVLGTTEPVKTLADIKGKRIRTVGRLTYTYDAIGANPIATLQANEVYESLQRGLIDGYTGLHLAILPGYKLSEVAKYALDPGTGIYAPVAAGMSKASYDDLSPELQEVFQSVARDLPAESVKITSKFEQQVCDAGEYEISILPEDQVEEWKAAVGETVRDAWAKDVTASGADPDAFWESYTAAIDAKSAEFGDYETAMKRCAG
jgi:TRAP-type C4-dicarboxylate transport system substrate-binding protein